MPIFKVEVMADVKGNTDDRTKLAAGMCYQPNVELARKTKVPVSDLWDGGHHTTMMHDKHHVTYLFENIPVSLVTFGLHLTHPFYNTSQRSGRYCTQMFGNDLTEYIHNFLVKYYQLDQSAVDRISKWVTRGMDFFENNRAHVTELARAAIHKERPFFKGNIDKHAERLAQEQLRCFISTITPTGMLYTVNLPTVAAMNRVAWNGPLKDLTSEMFRQVFSEDPPIGIERWHPIMNSSDWYSVVINRPIIDMPMGDPDAQTKTVYSKVRYQNEKGSLNCLPFSPRTAWTEDEYKVKSIVELSVGAYGQEQRHRSIRRSLPEVTGRFLLPPLLADHSASVRFATEFINDYRVLVDEFTPEVMINFIPYGATVKYCREAEINALIHSARKRMCWNAMSEMSQLEQRHFTWIVGNTDGLEPCLTGRCLEGSRYCGRDLKNRVVRNKI